MPTHPKSLLDLKSYSHEKLNSFFLKVAKLKKSASPALSFGERIGLLFFEPSTRTRMSFESAAIRCGLGPLVFDGGPNTSLEKGETVEDSVLNIAAMQPKMIVIRCGDNVDLSSLSQQITPPIINAGWGVKGHPTQALLDIYTLRENFPEVQGKKILIIGDIRHSRVAASHFEVLPLLGVQVGICGPQNFLIERPGVEIFKNLKDGLKWSDAVMALRVQFERHADRQNMAGLEYRSEFGLNKENLNYLKKEAIVMHPGPINHGLELESEVLRDPRCRVLQQVQNGVYVREALIRELYEQ